MATTSKLTANEVANSVNIANNTSKLYVKLTATTTGESHNNNTITSTVKVNGTTYKPTHKLPKATTTTIYENTFTITHNSDGNKTVDISYSIPTGISAGTLTGSTSVKLSKIPRYATSVQSLNSKTETSIKMNWSSDSTIDYLWYSKDNGSTWVAVGSVSAKSGTYNITGLSPNTAYKIKTRVRSKDSQLTTDSSVLSISTYDYPYCSETPDFIAGDELTIKLYNPLGRLVTVNFIGANGESLSTDETTGTSVTGYNSETFIDKLYNSLPNDTMGIYQIKVTYESSVKTTTNDNTYYIEPNTCRPSFSNFSYKDTNNGVTTVTGNDQVLVKGLSTLQVTIKSADKMTTQKGATPTRYIASIEGVSKNVNYSESDVTLDIGTVDGAGTKRLIVTAYDSRRNHVEAYKDITVLDYAKPVINLAVARLNNFEDETVLSINGTYSSLLVNNVEKNAIAMVQYRYKESDTNNWTEWVTAKTTVTNNKFTCNDIAISLDKTKAFDIEARVIDKLDENTATGTVDVGEAILFISSNKKQCYINGKQVMTGLAQDVNRTDLNDYQNEFLAGYGHNLSNTPTSDLNLGHLITVPRHDEEGYTMQLFSPYTTNDVYVRKCEAGEWGDWVAISTGIQNGDMNYKTVIGQTEDNSQYLETNGETGLGYRLLSHDYGFTRQVNDGNGWVDVTTAGTLGVNKKNQLGLNDAGNLYLRGELDDGTQYQLNAHADYLRFQKYENGAWTNIWQIFEASWGSNGYIKFANGFCIQWKYASVTAGGTAWGNVYYSDHSMGNWAIAFTNIYYAKAGGNSLNYWVTENGWTTTSAGTVRCFRPNSSTATNGIRILGIGRWK